jgi:hypothetical protein
MFLSFRYGQKRSKMRAKIKLMQKKIHMITQ